MFDIGDKSFCISFHELMQKFPKRNKSWRSALSPALSQGEREADSKSLSQGERDLG
jgi:hypothetical protein